MKNKLIIISQVFVPDPAAVGQYMADVAIEMAGRGHHVIVYTASRSYEDASVSYAPREVLSGVEIRRMRWTSFGKKSMVLRMLGAVSFMLQAFARMLSTPDVTAILFSTSPPLIGFAATLAAKLRRIKSAYWAMDLNPDQLVALGKLKADSLACRLLESVNRFVISRTDLVIALDRFMAERLLQRGDIREKLAVIPPWPHEEVLEPVAHELNPFRHQHGLDGKFVVMYSGNHSASNPLTTLLEAAVRFKEHPRLRFVFVGGGTGKAEVERYRSAHGLGNVLSLPYQPLSALRWSLAAADVHVVSMGDKMVGIIHPCKIYGAMNVARPILYFGPTPSHISDLLSQHGIGTVLAHGDTRAAVASIEEWLQAPPDVLAAIGRSASAIITRSLSQARLCGELCDSLERAFGWRTSAKLDRSDADAVSVRGSN